MRPGDHSFKLYLFLEGLVSRENMCLFPKWIISLIHDIAAMLVSKLSCKLAICYAGGSSIGKKTNCGKSARRNIEIAMLKVHFRI